MNALKRTLIAASAVALVLPAGCSRSRPPQMARTGRTHAPSEEVIRWLRSGEILVYRSDDWSGGYDDHYTDCAGSGFYFATMDGRRRVLRRGDAVCPLGFSTTFDVSADGALLAFPSNGILRELRLVGGRASPYPVPGFGEVSAPSFSPSDQQLAFSARSSESGSQATDRALVLFDRLERRVRWARPLEDMDLESPPSWSADGSRLAVSAYAAGTVPLRTTGSIFVTDTTGAMWSRIATGFGPSWSPTGEWIAFLVANEAPNSEGASVLRTSIWAVHPDGADPWLMFTTPDTTSFGSERERVMNGGAAGRLVWSPDGRGLAFSRLINGRLSIWIIDVGSLSLSRLAGND